MKKYLFTILTIFLTVVGCTKFPIDEDGLLITDREDCYISNLELLGADQRSVLTEKLVVIDEVQFGTDLRNIYPQFSLATDAKLDPKIVGKVDFSDLEHPKQYTVISGNRKVRKTYTVLITVQQP